MNLSVLMGRLTRDPELRHTQTGTAVTSFTVAIDRPYSKDREKECDFIDCVVWRERAEFVAKYLSRDSKSRSLDACKCANGRIRAELRKSARKS